MLTLEQIPGVIGRIFGAVDSQVKYYGNGQMWHDTSSWKRCSRRMEGILNKFLIENYELAERQTD